MKTIISLFISIILISQSYSLDTNIVKYLPLKNGNVWVYYSYTGGKMRLKITGTQLQNGHIYYYFEQTGNPCNCPLGNYPPFLRNLQPMRIDSANGNIMFLGSSCLWQNGEFLLDSLRGKIGDNFTSTCNLSRVYDTSTQNILGTIRKTIEIDPKLSQYGSSRKYAYGLGLYYSSIQCTWIPNTSCIINLLGSVIDGVVFGDTSYPVGINQISTEVPENFSLYQNYPNPFNPTTNIKFSVPQKSFVTIMIYNVLGEDISKLVSEEFSPGTYETNFDATNYPSGVYYYKLTVSSEQSTKYTETKKMVLIK